MARGDPGSALVSADVRRTIRGPLAERLVSRGSLQLDKMTETIEAFALAAAIGVAEDAAVAAVATFRGVRRRQEVIGTGRGIVLIDDFAHHPTRASSGWPS